MMIATAQKPEIARTRGPNLAILVKANAGVPMEEALRLADTANRVILSNKRLSSSLIGSDKWHVIYDALPCFCGTLVAYEKPGRKLGQVIEYADPKSGIRYVFPVPELCIGEKNVALVAEHPDLTLVPGGSRDRIVMAENVGIIAAFPGSDGWYAVDPVYALPTGNELSIHHTRALYLWRLENGWAS